MDSHSFSFHNSEPHPHNLNTSLTQDPYQRPSSSLYPELSPINSQQYPSQVLGDTTSSHNQQGDQGYIPPNQYRNERQESHPEQDDLLRKKVQCIEKRLDEGWYVAYKVWLSFLYFIGGFGAGYFGAGILSIMGFYGRRALGTSGILSLFFICSVCIIMLAWKERNALATRDWKLARDALMSMAFFAVFYLATIIVLFWFLHATNRHDVRGLEANIWVWITGYIIPVFINIFGAKKVCNLLKKRNEARAELYGRQIYNI